MKSININKLQATISRVLKAVEKGEDFEVIRYSKPVAVVVGSKKWEKLQNEVNDLKGSCRKCVDEFKKLKKR